MDTYELSVCQRCNDKHPEWHKEVVDTMTALFPGSSFSWPANSPNAQKFDELWSKHKVQCYIVVTGDGDCYDICKPCLLEVVEGFSK
jgi:hypothetical protein